MGRFLVTFLDNHDQIGSDYKKRYAADARDEQIIAGVGYLLCALGHRASITGTEQGFSGEGFGDEFIREAMFELDDGARSFLNPICTVYQEIAKIAALNRKLEALRFGRMYFREISGNGVDFGLPMGQPCTLAFSRILAEQEILVAYNTSTSQRRTDYVVVDNTIQKTGMKMEFLYGAEGAVVVEQHRDPGICPIL
jgi:alpha-amylase